MLREKGTRHAIAPAAIIRSVIVDALEGSTERTDEGGQILSHPLHNGFGQAAAKDCGRSNGDAAPVDLADDITQLFEVVVFDGLTTYNPTIRA